MGASRYGWQPRLCPLHPRDHRLTTLQRRRPADLVKGLLIAYRSGMRSTPRARSLIVITNILGAVVFASCANLSDAPVTEAETASVAPSPAVRDEPIDTVELGDGHLSFEIPQSWDAEFEDFTSAFEADETAPEFNGRSAQRATITNPGATVHVDVFTNIPWPDVVAVDALEVEVLHAEPLDMGREPSEEGHHMRLGVSIRENPEHTN